jgi:hypothetical protein
MKYFKKKNSMKSNIAPHGLNKLEKSEEKSVWALCSCNIRSRHKNADRMGGSLDLN